ncbi:MAG: hypothetical protein HEQ35_26325 [Gloeotrichia echinulata IR180]
MVNAASTPDPSSGNDPNKSNDALPNDIRESIAIANAKSVAEQPAMLSNLNFANLMTNHNLSQQNALTNQQAMYQLAITAIAKAVNKVSDLSPTEGLAIAKLDTSNDVAQQIADLKAANRDNNSEEAEEIEEEQ